MHSIRSKARRAAWRTDEGEPNYNPFARTRSKEATPDLENQTSRRQSRRRSEGDHEPVIEEDRRIESRQAEKDFGGPHHAGTAPPTSATTEEAPSPTFVSNGPSSPIGTSKESETTAIGDDKHHHKGLRGRLPFKKYNREETDGTNGNINGGQLEDEEKLDKEERKRRALKRKIPVSTQLRAVFLSSWINILLLAVPAGFGLYYGKKSLPNPDVPIFVVNFIAIIPLAGMLSYATEELALRVGEVFGGLLNASFGNAVELIVSVQALVEGQITIVKTSLIGSMLSNLLLVLGMSFFLGGISRLEQHFNVTVAQTAASLLALCIGSLIIPTIFHQQLNNIEGEDNKSKSLSHGTAVILLLVYACYLIFQLKSHVAMYNAPSPKVPKRKSSKEEGDAIRGLLQASSGTAAASGGGVNAETLVKTKEEEDDDDFEEPQLSVIGALITLAFSTTLVAFCSEFMVSSIEGITASDDGKDPPISTVFVGLILLPIVGNAAEHATAVTVAMKDKMDLAIGVAVGSSMQIALLVLPFIVVLGWILGKDDMSLIFSIFDIGVLFIAILLVNYLIQDGKSHWLEGVLLMSTYIIIAVAAFVHPETKEDGTTIS